MTNSDEMLRPKWVAPTQDKETLQRIIKEFSMHPVVGQLFVSRGYSKVEDIHRFLYSKLPNLEDPSLFKDMQKAVNTVYEVYKEEKKILVFGDNDVDGITGATLLTEFFRYLGISVEYFVPNRNSPNQGILSDALENARKQDASLLITVDCGITATDEIKELTDAGIDVIITDHHEPTTQVPVCKAILNPKHDHNYPNRDLTGVGVAFKFAHSVANHFIKKKELSVSRVDMKRYLDLVALGTIADMGALVGENRIMVRYGLKQLHKTKRVGLIKLLSICEINEEEPSTNDIASKVAPRLNSLGRIADPMKGVELLLLRDAKKAEMLAQELDLNNIERQRIERLDSEDIEVYIKKHPDVLNDKAIVLHSEKWHPGIIPILSARISKQYNRPAAIISIKEGIGKGSLRTIPEYPLLPILKENASLLLNFGGHDYAAGFSIEDKNIETFKQNFIAAANEMLKEHDIVPKLYLDARVNFKELTFDFLESLGLLEPFGAENPAPVFFCEAVQTWPPKVVGKAHLKLYLEQNNRVLEGIAFNLADRRPELTKKNLKVEIAFTPYVNTFLNKSSIQLLIRDFRVI